MIRSLTILLGSMTTVALAFQVTMISAMAIEYWEVGDGSTGWSIWFGIGAVGLMLSATIQVLHMPRAAGVMFLLCVPLVASYESTQNTKFYSLEIPESIGVWVGVMSVVLAILAYFSHLEQESQ